MDDVDVQRLLDQLCVRLGYCLPPSDQKALVADPPSSIDAFTDAVIRAEGLDPVLMPRDRRRHVKSIVAEAFGQPLYQGRRRRR